jgi:arylsulfatase A-like enzyme
MPVHTRPNVVLLVADSLRADHLAAYGYPHETGPSIEALARNGAVCERLLCAGLPTQPSFTTLYTGQHPIRHGVVAHGGDAELPAATPVLGELFLAAGYETCAVDSLWREKPWLGRGFEYYIDPSLTHALPILVTAEEVNRRALEWVRTRGAAPFFLVVHYWDTHYPYVPPARHVDPFYSGDPVDPRNRSLEEAWSQPIPAIARDTWLRTPAGPVTDAEYVRALYDGEIRYLDEHLDRFLAVLDRVSDPRNTLVVLMGDHGESLTEHRIFFEHFGLYDCTARVPFVARWPGVIPAGRRVPHLLDTSRIAATLLEAAGLPIPGTIDGRSFWNMLSGDEPGSDQDVVVGVESSWQAKWSLTTDGHRLILARAADFLGNPDRELYDLRADPGETRNIVTLEPAVAATLEAVLENWIADRVCEYGLAGDPVRLQGISLGDVLATRVRVTP